MATDPAFKVSLIAIPYRHSSFGDSEYRDAGMSAYFNENGYDFRYGYNKEKDEWLDLKDLAPDYVFFQTPYDYQFPYSYTAKHVSTYAQICYIPYYGILVFRGEVESITHPHSFFRNVNHVFLGNKYEKKDLIVNLREKVRGINIHVTGSPLTDRVLQCDYNKLYARKSIKKCILWTPRWNTSEGICHFFDYKDHLIKLAENNLNINLIFRPHPLCFQNFLTTGEMTKSSLDEFRLRFDNLVNARIDETEDYLESFANSDILITDVSSIMVDYFVTGKPIIYTHKIDTFNHFASHISKGFYWVANQSELDETLQMLLTGADPLKEKRLSITRQLFPRVKKDATSIIIDTLKKNVGMMIKN
jgi:hypothetical protein